MNEELLSLFRADQSEKRTSTAYGTPEHWELRQREIRRRERASALIESGGITAPEDYYRAAVIFQRSDNIDDIWQTHTLAVAAAKLGHRPARWLAAASLDRWLMRQGMPQKYGTGTIADEEGQHLWDVDPQTNDRERARWDVPTLRELETRARRNGETAPESPDFITPAWVDEPLHRWHSH